MQRRIHRVGVVVAVLLLAHLWMLPTGGSHGARHDGHHPPSVDAATAELPTTGGCTTGMAACVAAEPDDPGLLLLAAAAGLAAVAATPRRRHPLLLRHRVRRDDLHPPRPCVPSYVVLLQ